MENSLVYRCKYAVIGLLLVLCVSCINDRQIEECASEVKVNFALSSASTNPQDPYMLDGEDQISSVIVSIYNSTNALPEQVLVVDAVAPTNQWNSDIVVLSSGTKQIYALANYKSATLYQGASPLSSDPALLKQQLESMNKTQLEVLTVQSVSIEPGALLMRGKVEKLLSGTSTDTPLILPLEVKRLQTRIDLHLFKSADFSGNLRFVSATLKNRYLSSQIAFGATPAMYVGQTASDQPYTATANTYLTTDPGTIPPSSQAHALFYSYPVIAAQVSATPYIELKVEYQGDVIDYRIVLKETGLPVDFTDNLVLSVKAVLENNQIKVTCNIVDWGKQQTIIRPDCKAAFRVLPPSLDFVIYNTQTVTFELIFTDPKGGNKWTASLTNGLDFAFDTSGLNVFKGDIIPYRVYILCVKAIRPWRGVSRFTELYITVDGEEIDINGTATGNRWTINQSYN